MRTNKKSTRQITTKSTKPAVKSAKPAAKSAQKPDAKAPQKAAAKVPKKADAKAAKKTDAKAAKKTVATAAKKTAAKAPTKAAAKAPKKVGGAKSGKQAAAKSAPVTAARLRQDDPISDTALLALPRDYEASPDMPVAIAQAELTALGRMAQTVAGALAKVGITPHHITALGRFAKRLGLAESQWQAARTGTTLSVNDRKKLLEAEALTAQLVAGGRWACRKDLAARATLDKITEGSGLADTIADLSDLVAFWAEHPRELVNTDITARDLARATALAAALEVTADKETRDLDAAAAQALRNRCFWAADELAREVREGGRYAFRLQPKMAAKFTSRYRLTINRRNRDKAPAKPPAPSPSPI